MKRVIGYVIAIVGLAVMAVGLGTFKLDIPLLNSFDIKYVVGAGIVLIIAGIVVSLTFGKGGRKKKQEKEEVPIYRGDRIVGYRKE